MLFCIQSQHPLRHKSPHCLALLNTVNWVRNILHELDTQIAATIETKNELEGEIIKAETAQEVILDKINQIRQMIDSHASPVTCLLFVSSEEWIYAKCTSIQDRTAYKLFT